MNERSFSTDKGVIHYWIGGPATSAITLVFLPGLTADHRLFDKQVEFFEPRCGVLRGMHRAMVYRGLSSCRFRLLIRRAGSMPSSSRKALRILYSLVNPWAAI